MTAIARTLAAAALLAGSAGTAAQAQSYDWSGFYAGLHAGIGHADVRARLNAGRGSYDLDGALFGGHLGWNWQTGAFVWGAVASVAHGGIEGNWAFDPPRTLDSRYGTMASLRLRAGYAADRVLFYATAGLATAEVTSRRSAPAARASDWLSGPVVGAGVEFAAGQAMSVQIEYLYHDFGRQRLDDYRLTHDVGTVTVGVNFRF